MQQIKNRNLAELLMQLRFIPPKKRRKQLDSAEKLLGLVDRSREYPFEFVCFKITGFHPKSPAGRQMIKGDELAEDLRIFTAKLSGQVARPVAEQGEKVYNIEELAAALGASTKTINRWQKRGLIARKFIFDDGKKRFGFSQSTVDKFLKKNPDLIAGAKTFTRLTKKQKQQIVKRAAALAAQASMSRYQVIDKIAAEIGRAHETVRYTLLDYEKVNPDRPVSNEPPGVISPADTAELYKLFKQGRSIRELMGRFRRSRSSIYRIVNRRRARALLARKIEFITSGEFLEDDAEEKILAPHQLDVSPSSTGAGLNRERELELFRRYNYLKYLALKTRTGIKPNRASSARLGKIENYLAEAETIKKRIIEANLRLVVSIANKHTVSGVNLPDLISEGNFALMNAVEKFDYTRGFRFATYASWAIAKDYARKIPASARPDKAATASLADIHRYSRTAETTGVVAVERARRNLVQAIKNELDEREQYIILNHFGLVPPLRGVGIKKRKKTLMQIGLDLNLSRERVRQIELVALQKLRRSLSIEEFELLTG